MPTVTYLLLCESGCDWLNRRRQLNLLWSSEGGKREPIPVVVLLQVLQTRRTDFIQGNSAPQNKAQTLFCKIDLATSQNSLKKTLLRWHHARFLVHNEGV